MDSTAGPSSVISNSSSSMSSLCTPAMVYIVIAIIGIMMSAFHNFQPLSLLMNVIFVIVWTWFLNFLCTKGYTGISWFLVLLPFILLLLAGVIMLEIFATAAKKGTTMPTYGSNNNNFSATYGSR